MNYGNVYKDKYLKYKNKYMMLKNQFGQGQTSHSLLDSRTYKYIGTYETKEERYERERRNKNPIQGYKIWNSIDEIIKYNYDMSSSDVERQRFISTIKNNLNLLFGASFDIINSLESELFYIDARGDGNCFLNSLYIYSIITGKTEQVYQLYSLTGIRESNPINFSDFKSSMLFLSDTLLDSRIGEIGEELVSQFKLDSRNSDIPYTETFGIIYSNNFNTRIMTIQINSRFQFVSKTSDIVPDNYSPEHSDHMIIIQKENIHFGLLIPAENNIELRKNLFDFFQYHIRDISR